MRDFGMELDAVEAAVGAGHRRDAALQRIGERGEARRKFRDAVAVAHPDALPAGQTGEQVGRLANAQIGAAELMGLSSFDRSAEVARHQLMPVTDAQHRLVELEKPAVGLRTLIREHACRPAGKDDALEPFQLAGAALTGRISA